MKDSINTRYKLKWNDNWKFFLGDVENAHNVALDDSEWTDVVLPHTPKIEKIDVCLHYQGISWYRKIFHGDDKWKNQKIWIEFEAAMQIADVWINGKYVMTHKGGYLPFTIDLTQYIEWDKENVISVKLDNQDQPNIPPGRPLKRLDFCYFGGLYRNVNLYTTQPIYITDSIYTDEVAGGGVFVTSSDISNQKANVHIKTHIKNEFEGERMVHVLSELVDANGNVVGHHQSEEKTIKEHDAVYYEQTITINNPKLWHPDAPYLYTVHHYVYCNDILMDQIATRIGIRQIEVKSPEGLFINSELLQIRGANRQQQFPYIGNAASDNAQYRDAKKLKEAGFHFIRSGHYPQSTAFLDACDELGLMVIEPTPGWQWCREGEFQELVIQNIRDMIRKDRNHPCIMTWEVSLNETSIGKQGATDEFFHQCHIVAHEEHPSSLTSGDTMGRKSPDIVEFDIPYTCWEESTKSRPLVGLSGKMGIDREYGDFEYGGQYSTTRRTRGEGEKALLQQAWNFQWGHNSNRRNPHSLGDSIWGGIDYNRGCGWNDYKTICTCGVLDTFRLPKFAYYFYQSQRKSDVKRKDIDSGPMVYIANYWTSQSPTDKVIVYSNCDEVKLYLNGRLIDSQSADQGPDAVYKKQKIVSAVRIDGADIPHSDDGSFDPLASFLMQTVYDGGNVKHIDQAPFTFKGLAFEKGELKAVGYIGDEEVVIDIRQTPDKAKGIELLIDKSGRELVADGADFVFVYANVVDENGTLVSDAEVAVEFEVQGPVQLIGENPVYSEAGIAPILLKAGTTPGEIRILARSKGLDTGSTQFNSIL